MKNTGPKYLLLDSTGINLFCPIAIAFFPSHFLCFSWTGDFAEQRAAMAYRTTCRLLILLFKPSLVSANLLSRLAGYWSVIETLQVVNLVCSLSFRLIFGFLRLFMFPRHCAFTRDFIGSE